METARKEEIVQLLTTFYDDGRVPCADASPLHIALDPGAAQVQLRGEAPYAVVFPEVSFVQMIEQSGMPPTATLVRVWLSTVYFDSHVYPWAHRIALSETTSRQDSSGARWARRILWAGDQLKSWVSHVTH